MLSLLAAALLTIPDAAGDTRGDGSYVLPTRPPLSASALDLRELKVESGTGGKLRLTVGLGALQNPWNAPLGYSAGVLDLFVKSRVGGDTSLTGLGFVTPPQQGWQYHIRVTGFGSSLDFVPDGKTSPQPRPNVLQVRLNGSALQIDTPIPAGQYSYWVTSSVYSPFTQDGMLRPGTGGGNANLVAAHAASPVPVDVISGGEQVREYALGVLQPVGQTRDRRALLLLGLAAAGLLLALVATVRVWRKGPV